MGFRALAFLVQDYGEVNLALKMCGLLLKYLLVVVFSPGLITLLLVHDGQVKQGCYITLVFQGLL